MKTVLVEDDCVSTLSELAESLADMYGWTSYEVAGDTIYFKANADGEPVDGRLDLSGFAYDADTGERIDAWDVDWDECFDQWSNHIWAEDENLEVVMIHG